MDIASSSSAYSGSSSDPYQNNPQHDAPAFYPPSAFQATAQGSAVFQQFPSAQATDASASALLFAGMQQLQSVLMHQQHQIAQLQGLLEVSAIHHKSKDQTILQLQEQLYKAEQIVQKGAAGKASVFIPKKRTGDGDSVAMYVFSNSARTLLI